MLDSSRADPGNGFGSFPWVILFIVILCLPNARYADASASASGEPVKAGDYFEYKIHETLTHCTGAYYDYDEDTRGTGRYQVVGVSGDNATVHYDWEWKYTSDTEPSASGSRDDIVTFDWRTGEYLEGFDLDIEVEEPRFAWFRIDPHVTHGDVVRILDKEFTVTDTEAVVWSNWLPREAIELTYEGTGSRDDSYGWYTTTIEDRFYFARDSGYIIAERYVEHHQGYYQGDKASFDWEFDFDVTDSSYDRPVHLKSFFTWYFGIPGSIIAIVYGLFYFFRWLPRPCPSGRIKRLWKFNQPLTIDHDKTTSFFAPFIEDMMTKALAAGDRVAIAYDSGRIKGVAIYHRDARIGTLFAEDTEVNELLRKFIGTKDFFCETKHRTDKGSRNKAVYNIYETHGVFVKEDVRPEPYDRELIRQMEPDDLPQVCRISKKAYKIRGRRWFKTLLAQGEVALVARIGDEVVGFAFATVVDEHARFHSLTVDPEFRGRGIGKELMRARLNLVHHLGATEALLEIADWNLPSLRVSSTFGFVRLGRMYVETIRTKRVKRNIVRR